jgi:antitoxin (DNA-binding transcriptional repressor) of toxin-antitoxin stability system
MKKVSMVDFRRYARQIIAQLHKGKRLLLTRRGKPVALLEPIDSERLEVDEQFYSLCELAEPGGSMTNRQIDEIVYGQ